MLVEEPPRHGGEAASTLRRLVREWDVDVIAASATDQEFRPLLAAASADRDRYQLVARGPVLVFEVRG